MLDDSIDFTKKNFIKYLSSLGISPKSHKNYRSDLNHFISWVIIKIHSFGSNAETLTEVVPFLNHEIVNAYRAHLTDIKTPEKTINRRLSTLRHLSKFLLSSHSIEANFMEEIENISQVTSKKASAMPLVTDFKNHLISEKVSKNTIKNYTSDVRQFLTWLESQKVSGS